MGARSARAKSPDMPVVNLRFTRSGRRVRVPPASTNQLRPASTRRAVCIPYKDVPRPGDGVFYPTARWLRLDPQLEVLGPIVSAHSVPMVNGLTRQHVASQDGLHHQDVLEDVTVVPLPTWVVSCLRVDVSLRATLARLSASSPGGVRRTSRSLRLARHAGAGLSAHGFGTTRALLFLLFFATAGTGTMPARWAELAAAGSTPFSLRPSVRARRHGGVTQASREQLVPG
jgi:hypothetical protein